ncbi:MAG: hypothetical protein E7265_11395 [Lachnospiraceae bacterium]|nr:hypothetical protein [Lachnospiraceae bacterium]
MNKRLRGIMYRLPVLILAVIIMFCPFDVRSATQKGTVNTDGLNVREGAGTNYNIIKLDGNFVKLSKGTSVTIKESLPGDWYRVTTTYNNKKVDGFVASAYVTLNKNKNILASNTNITAKLLSKRRINSKASKNSAYLKTPKEKTVRLNKGAKLNITGVRKVSGEVWYEICFTYKNNPYTGYIDSKYVNIKKTQKGTASAITKKTTVYRKTSLSSPLKIKKKTVKLAVGKKVRIISEKTVKKAKWFYISFKYNKKTRKGYVPAWRVMFNSGKNVPDTTTPPGSPTASPKPVVPLSDAEFEAHMTSQGFPESYKNSLRILHAAYPVWQFSALNTGLDWNEVLAAETVIGRSLVPNTRTSGWKSHEEGAYNWVNDSYIVFDGLQWVNASKEAVAYYLDPRNFLDEKYIFMFEALAFEPAYQNVTGVETIFNNTLLSGQYEYTDDAGNTVSKTYKDTVMEAAAINGVSPYHLASRIRQEVVTGTASVSNSVTGTMAGFEGIYNFYNIGASDSSGGGAVANGLRFASKGTTYLRPWNNQYKSIVGGAQYIASNYISKGQNTLYLERWNVTPNKTYDHQYMTNAAAAYSEAAKVYNAYKAWMSTTPILFVIPVYNNMPEQCAQAPTGNLSPNNYLRTLDVTGGVTQSVYALAPLFDPAKGGSDVYTLTVPMAETSVNISAVPVNNKAIVAGGGTIPLTEVLTTVLINVTAENGNVRTYTINIIRV